MLQKEFLGNRSINNIKNIFNEVDARKILIVTGKKSFTLSGAEGILDNLIKNKDVVKFNDFEANPKLEDVYSGIEFIRQENPDLVVAIGGGSVIDMAKLINILAAQTNHTALDFINDCSLINDNGKPLVAIPTTAGSGSQATHFAVIYIQKVKYSVAHAHMLPDYAIVDYNFCYHTPKEIAACSAMDALSQAVESYWSKHATYESKKYSSEAIKLILPAISLAINNKDKHAIQSMSLAAHLAGKAINITKTTAPHAISYTLTSNFKVPHGHAVAALLGPTTYISSLKTNKDFRLVLEEIFSFFGCESVNDFYDIWHKLMHECGLSPKLNFFGVSIKDIELIVNNVNIERISGHAVALEKKDLEDIVKLAIFGR